MALFPTTPRELITLPSANSSTTALDEPSPGARENLADGVAKYILETTSTGEVLLVKKLSVSELVAEVKGSRSRGKIKDLFDRKNVQYKDIMNESAYKRVWNLIERENLKTTPHRGLFWALDEVVFVPFYKPESEDEARDLRTYKIDYLIDDSLGELKRRCLEVIEDELGKSGSL